MANREHRVWRIERSVVLVSILSITLIKRSIIIGCIILLQVVLCIMHFLVRREMHRVSSGASVKRQGGRCGDGRAEAEGWAAEDDAEWCLRAGSGCVRQGDLSLLSPTLLCICYTVDRHTVVWCRLPGVQRRQLRTCGRRLPGAHRHAARVVRRLPEAPRASDSRERRLVRQCASGLQVINWDYRVNALNWHALR